MQLKGISYTAWGGNPPSMRVDTVGARFFGFNDVSLPLNPYRVIRLDPNGTAREIHLPEPIGGQGHLEELRDGTLWAVGPLKSGNGQPHYLCASS